MKGALARLGIRGFNPKLRHARERLTTLCTPEGEAIPPKRPRRAAARHDTAPLHRRPGQTDRNRASGTAETSTAAAIQRYGPRARTGPRHRRRDGRHARARNTVAESA